MAADSFDHSQMNKNAETTTSEHSTPGEDVGYFNYDPSNDLLTLGNSKNTTHTRVVHYTKSEDTLSTNDTDESLCSSTRLDRGSHSWPQTTLLRNHSMFSKKSLANVRLETVTCHRKTPATIWLIVATAAMTYTLHGFSNSVTNGILTNDTFVHQFTNIDTIHTKGKILDYNSTIQGVTVGLYQVGCALGAGACYFLTDYIGRKKTIHLIGIFNCIGVILQATSFTLPHLIVGRVLMGLGIGAGHATFPLYLAECVTSRIRGRATIACAAAGNFGHFIGAVVEIGFFFVHNSTQWRVPIGLELIWALMSAILPFYCPESPRFLLRKGRHGDCIKAQSRLCGLPEGSYEVEEEIRVLQDALYEAGQCKGKDAKPPARMWFRIAIATFIQIMSSMSGIDVISFFSTQTFESQLHFSPLVSRFLTMGLQACQWLWSTIAIFLIDTLGRRPLLLGCAALMAISMGSLFGLTCHNATQSMLKASILFYFFTMCAYPVGYHLIPSMYVAEVSPGSIRHQVCAFTGFIHFIFDFTVTLITPIAFDSIHSRYYLVYLATNTFTFIVIYFLFIETKGLELETIDEIFGSAPSCFQLVNFGKSRACLAKEIQQGKSLSAYGDSCDDGSVVDLRK